MARSLIAIGTFTLFLLVAIGGWARVVLRDQHFSWPWLAILTLTTVYGGQRERWARDRAETYCNARIEKCDTRSGEDISRSGPHCGEDLPEESSNGIH